MKLLAIVGSPRKGKATDKLVDKAVEGCLSVAPDTKVVKINLGEHNIQFCRNCLVCRESKTSGPVAECSIHDDMDAIKQEVLDSDLLIFGSPVHMGYATALMMAFLERICWTFAKPEKNILTIKGCPVPRSDKKRNALIIVTSGIVPPLYKRTCNWATEQIKGVIHDSLNANVVGELYAGDIEHRGVESYFVKAFRLGKKLA
ncbi:MAG: flavodoxin family protein [Chlorobiales bacterium]|nr:flavodoxin family protein [Chlorobiales bacterium]